MPSHLNSRKGITLIELAAALFILAIITAVLVPIAGSLMDVGRNNEAFADMARIYTAVVGDPSKNFYGYVGDTGQFPSNLMDLVRSPGGSVNGWNGPYLTHAKVESDVVYDPFGSPYECYYFADTTQAVADQFAIMSRGPDRETTKVGASNACTNFNGGAIPSTYATAGNDRDNVVYPRFTDNPTLLKYNHIGTLALTIFNFDRNSLVNAMVPGCPGFYTVTITSVPRGSNDSFSFPYNPGAASVDLPQGLYKVTVTSPESQGSLWQDQVTISPGATVSKTINIPTGLNSNTTPARAFGPRNDFGATLTFYWFFTNMTGNNVNNATTGSFNAANNTPRACATIFARTSTNQIVDTLIYPYLTTTYNRRVNQSVTCTLTVLNRNASDTAAKRQVLVYDTGLLIGVVSSRGNYKSRQIFNIKTGDIITTFDSTGAATAPTSQTACTTVTIP